MFNNKKIKKDFQLLKKMVFKKNIFQLFLFIYYDNFEKYLYKYGE